LFLLNIVNHAASANTTHHTPQTALAMPAQVFFAGVALRDIPTFLYNMIFTSMVSIPFSMALAAMESIPTNALLVILMGVLVVHSFALKTVKVDIANLQANTNTESTQEALSDELSGIIVAAIQQRIAQLEAQSITPPPSLPRLTSSALSLLNTPPKMPTSRPPRFAASLLSTPETTSRARSPHRLGFSAVNVQATSPVKPASPVLSRSPISGQSITPVLPSPLSSVSISTQTSSPVAKSPTLFFSPISTQDITPVQSKSPKPQALSFSPISAHSSAPVEPKSHVLSLSSISSQSSGPVTVKVVKLSLSQAKVLHEVVPFIQVLVPSETGLVKWSPGTRSPEVAWNPYPTLKELEAQIHNVVMQNIKLKATMEAEGKVYVAEMESKQQQLNAVQSEYRERVIQHKIYKMSVDDQSSKMEVLLRDATAWKVKVADLELLLGNTCLSESALKDQLTAIGAQLDEVKASESSLKNEVGNIEMELNQSRTSEFFLQEEVTDVTEQRDQAWKSNSALSMELDNSKITENALKEEVDEYAKIMQAMQASGIDIDKYKMLAKQPLGKGNNKVEPVATLTADKVTSSSGTGLEATADTFTSTSESTSTSTFSPATEVKPVINKATNPLATNFNPGASRFEPKSNSSPAVEVKSPLTKVTTPNGGGLGASIHSTASTTSSSPAIEAPAVGTKVTTHSMGGLGASRFSSATTSDSPPAIAVKPAADKATTPRLGGLATSRHSLAPTPTSSPTIAAKPAADKATTSSGVGLGTSRFSSQPESTSTVVTAKAPALPTTNQEQTRTAVGDGAGYTPFKQAPGLGGVFNAADFEEQRYCRICAKTVTIEFEFDPTNKGKKFYLWDAHDRDFHGRCSDCRKEVPAVWDSKADKMDFTEHSKICKARPAPSTTTAMPASLGSQTGTPPSSTRRPDMPRFGGFGGRGGRGGRFAATRQQTGTPTSYQPKTPAKSTANTPASGLASSTHQSDGPQSAGRSSESQPATGGGAKWEGNVMFY
jgi:hypothetical protein